MVRTSGLKNYSDVHYTKPAVAKMIISHFKPTGSILEPFSGDGAFLNHLPPHSDWCEIQKGRNFFDYNKKVDWIITNPPYSNLTDVMRHCFFVSRNTVLLVPLSKIYSSAPRLRLVKELAGIKEKLHLGTGRDIGFDSGFPFAAIHFATEYRGPSENSWPVENHLLKEVG